MNEEIQMVGKCVVVVFKFIGNETTQHYILLTETNI